MSLGNQATVIRNEETSQVDTEELTVGNIVVIKTGEKVPADIRMIEVNKKMKTGLFSPMKNEYYSLRRA